MPNQKKTPWMAGLFAGIFSSAAGDWVPMSQLRRFSSVGAWVVFFGSSSYGLFKFADFTYAPNYVDKALFVVLWLLNVVIAAASFPFFLWIGGKKFGVEKTKK